MSDALSNSLTGSLVDFLENNLKAHITRWDGAYDDFEGKHSVDNALRMYKEGLFSNGGRKPLMDQAGNWLEPDGRGRISLYWVKRQRQTYTRL